MKPVVSQPKAKVVESSHEPFMGGLLKKRSRLEMDQDAAKEK